MIRQLTLSQAMWDHYFSNYDETIKMENISSRVKKQLMKNYKDN